MTARTLRWIVVLGAIALVEVLCRSGIIDRITMIPPTEMIVAIVTIHRNEKKIIYLF